MQYNDDNMLMIDLEEVDEQAWDDAVDALMDDDEYLDSYQAAVDDLAGLSDDERVAFMNEFHQSCERLFEEMGVSEIIAKL